METRKRKRHRGLAQKESMIERKMGGRWREEVGGLKNIEKMVSVKMKVRKVSELSRDRRGKCKVTSLGL